jgi:hypothetical protein
LKENNKRNGDEASPGPQIPEKIDSRETEESRKRGRRSKEIVSSSFVF